MEATASKPQVSLRFNRQTLLSITLFLIGAFVIWGATTVQGSTETCLLFEAGLCEDTAHIVIPTQAYMFVVGGLMVIASIAAVMLYARARVDSLYQTPQEIRMANIANGILLSAALLIIPTILVGAAANNQTNVISMLSATLTAATPIGLGAMAGLWCERSGVVNIAIEGMMLIAACAGFTAVFLLRRDLADIDGNLSLFIGVIVGIISGGIAALLHAWLSITFRTDQIVSGTVINILAVGATSFVRREVLLSSEAGGIKTPNIEIPILADIPYIGQELFNQQPIFYLMFVIIIVTNIVLFNTRWGLRMRAVGEHPSAADTLGINVNRTRWINVFIGGLIAGLAGAWFSLEINGRFIDEMTRGAGFIALAALIFGKWTPFGALGAALLFGYAQALDLRLQTLKTPIPGTDTLIPQQFLQMVPYVFTIVVVAGLMGRSVAPKALGQPYVKE